MCIRDRSKSANRNEKGKPSCTFTLNDNLTAGFTKSDVQETIIESLGITCDQCHSQKLTLEFEFLDLSAGNSLEQIEYEELSSITDLKKKAAWFSGACQDCKSPLTAREFTLAFLFKVLKCEDFL